MSKSVFKKVALIGRQRVEGMSEILMNLKNYLESLHVEVLLEQETAAMMTHIPVVSLSKDELHSFVDLIIVVGGDGSLLNAARIASKENLPVLGINRGKLGFLTDVHPDHLETIADIIKGKFQEEQRFLLDAHIDGKQQLALNDVVLVPGSRAQMIGFDVYFNKHFAYSLRADGLIIATPTGSTAYALSGGGPILHPELDAIVVVPISPHTLSSRPIVVQGDTEIEIVISELNANPGFISCDGQEHISAPPGTHITIAKSKKTFRLIHPMSYNYYETLREKLGWKG